MTKLVIPAGRGTKAFDVAVKKITESVRMQWLEAVSSRRELQAASPTR